MGRGLPIDEGRRRAFESARLRGSARIEDFVPPPGDARRADTLEELVCIELECAWRERGTMDPDPVEEWIARFPELADPEAAARLFAEEFRVRHRFGDRPTPESVAARYRAVAGDARDLEAELDDDAELSRIVRDRARAEADRALVGGTLGRFVLEQEIGRGTFARVFRARDPQLSRAVAIKVLRPELLADSAMVARFYREARTAAQLRHPGIVPVHEVGEDRGLPFLVADFVEGPSFEDVLAERRPTPREAARWVRRVADALDYAHRFGVVHRDVKPANLLSGPDGEPLVADFGLALWSEDDADLTRHGQLLGTPAYMSPEQARGGEAVDARSDVYGLGVVLYRMLTGRLPFEGGWHATLRRVEREEPTPPRRIDPSIPRDLEVICSKAMAKDPARRYADAGRMAEDLRRSLEYEPIQARAPGIVERAVLWWRREPALGATVAVAVAVVVLVATLGALGILREQDRVQRELGRSLVAEARATIRARDTGWWWDAWERVERAVELGVGDRDELRDLAASLLGTNSPSLRVARSWDLGAPARALGADPSGARLAVGCDEGGLALVALDDAQAPPVRLLAGASVTGVAFHPSAPLLACAAEDGRLRVFALASDGDAPALVAERDLGAGALADLARGRSSARLAAACADGRVALTDDWTLAADPEWLVGHTDAIVDVDFAPGDDRLATASEDVTVRLWDLAGRRALDSYHVFDPPSCVHAVTPELLISASPATYGFRILDVSAPNPLHAANQAHSAAVRRLDVLGERYLSASDDGTVRLWTPELREVAVAGGGYDRVRDVLALPNRDGFVAAYGDGTVRVWELGESRRTQEFHSQIAAFLEADLIAGDESVVRFGEDGTQTPRRHLPDAVEDVVALEGDAFAWAAGRALRLSDGAEWDAHAATVAALAARRDGARIATGSSAGEVAVWDRAGAEHARFSSGVGAVRRLSWSADGERLCVSGEDGIELWLVEAPYEPDARLGAGLAVFADERVVVGREDGSVELVDVRGEERVRFESVHGAAITALAWDAENGRLYSGAADRSLLTWDGRRWSPGEPLQPGPFAPRWIAPDPTGRHLIAGNAPAAGAYVWDLERGAPVVWHQRRGYRVAAFRADGRSALVATDRGSVVELCIDELERRVAREAAGESDPTPDAVRMLYGRTLVPGGHSLRPWCIALDRTRERVATCSHGGTVQVRVVAGEELPLAWSRDAHDGPAWSVAFDREGERLASTSEVVHVHDAETGETLTTLPRQEKLVTGSAFLADDERLVTCSLDGTVRVWSLDGPRLLADLHRADHAVHAVELDPSGRWLAAACHDGAVRVWDADAPLDEGATPARVLRAGGSPFWALGFRDDGAWMAAADEAGAITLWSVPDFERLVTLTSDAPLLRSVDFAPNGERIAAARLSGPAVVWDLGALRRELGALGLGF